MSTLLKKEFTSFDVAAAVRELRETILGSRINNIYQPDDKTAVFKLRKIGEPTLTLILEAGRRMHLTSYIQEKPRSPPAFCMALRKYLKGGRLTNIEQHEFERVVVFSFETGLGDVKLILELFGDGNIILVNGDGNILHAMSYKRMRDRNVLRGETFRFAPSSRLNPLKVNEVDLRDGLRGFGDVNVVRALTLFLSIGGIYAEEILLKAGVDKGVKCGALKDSDIKAILDSTRAILSQVISGKLEPYVVLSEEGEFIDAVPVKLDRYGGFKHQPYGSFNEALDEFYTKVTIIKRTETDAEVEELKREVEKLKRVVAEQEGALEDLKARAEKYRLIGNTIYAHSSELQALLDKFLLGKSSGKGWDEIVSEVLAEKGIGLRPSAFLESFDARNLIINVSVNGLRFGLNLRKGLFANASGYYELAKRAERKLEGLCVALKEARERLEGVKERIEKAEALRQVKLLKAVEELEKRKVKHKEWFEKFRWFTSSDGFLVVAGKDAISNEILIKKHVEPNDVVFHADVVGAPFVVIKTRGTEPSEQCLREAGEFAAAFSRGWKEGLASVDVYWVKPEQLRKGGLHGERVPRGAFVVVGKRNWVHGVPLRLAIGLTVKNGEVQFLGGPVDAIKAKAEAYVVLAPGDQGGKGLFKRILEVLSLKVPKELRERVLKASFEAVRNLIPYGKGIILER